MNVRSRLSGELAAGAYKGGAALARLAPRPVGMGLTSVVGRSAAVASPERRLMVERNLRRAHGRDMGRTELARRVGDTFESYARYYYDSFRLPTMDLDAVARGIDVDGEHHIDEIMAAGGVGPVLALPHLGGWEWAARWITGVKGWGLAAVVEPLDEEVFQWFLDFRRSLGMTIIPLGPDAAAQVATAALEGKVVCLLCDRDLTGTGVEVDFFGERTTLPAGPAVMALRTGCQVLPTAVYFDEHGDGVHGVVRPPLDATRTPGERLRHDVSRMTQDLAHELEVLIRRAPEQWHLMQPNWPSDHEALAELARASLRGRRRHP